MKTLLVLGLAVFPSFSLDTAFVRFTPSPITIDGALDEPAWGGADTLHGFQFPWGNDRHTASRVRLLWDDSAFYIGAVYFDTFLIAACTSGTAIDGDDMLETHMAPDVAHPDYFYIIEHNPNLITRSGFRRARPAGTNDWKENWTRVTQVAKAVALHGTKNVNTDSDTSWVIEIRVPFQAVAGWQAVSHTAPSGWAPAAPPEEGNLWRYNICRQNQNYDSDTLADWSIWSHNGNFPYDTGMDGVHLHDHNNFGVLVFTKTIAVEGRTRPFASGLALDASPNPCNRTVTIRVSDPRVKVEVYDTAGRLMVGPFTGSVLHQWDASAVRAGVYAVRAVLNGNVMVKKAVVAR